MSKATVKKGNKKQEVEINDLIFKELIKRGYSLEGNTRIWDIADSKLWYLTPEQSQAYLDLEDSENYEKGIASEEYHLIENNIQDILEKVGKGPLNVVDLGCGDGRKAAHFAKHLKKKMEIRYCPIDISGYMVEKAIETFQNLDVEEIIKFKYNISDFENLENITPLLRKGEFKENLFLFLGYTVGNFEINELLYEIRSAMKDGEILIITFGLGNHKWHERAASAKHDKYTDRFLKHTIKQLALAEDEIEFGSRYRNSRIEFYYTIKKDKTIEFQNKKIHFQSGDQVIVAVAYKHDKNDLLHILNMYFKEVDLKISKDKSTSLAICKK
ncbi:MAG: L-histidine N(alpha)-methyltransferase [Candidatus Nanoarchaeia archaeon]